MSDEESDDLIGKKITMISCNCPSCSAVFDSEPDDRTCTDCGNKVTNIERVVTNFGAHQQITNPDGEVTMMMEGPSLFDTSEDSASQPTDILGALSAIANAMDDDDDDDDDDEYGFFACDCECGTVNKLFAHILESYVDDDLMYECDGCEKEIDPQLRYHVDDHPDGWYPLTYDEYSELD